MTEEHSLAIYEAMQLVNAKYDEPIVNGPSYWILGNVGELMDVLDVLESCQEVTVKSYRTTSFIPYIIVSFDMESTGMQDLADMVEML